jgi:hypothetical protein
MLEEHLELPFGTPVLGLEVEVVAIGPSDDGGPVAACRHGRESQRIPLAGPSPVVAPAKGPSGSPLPSLGEAEMNRGTRG